MFFLHNGLQPAQQMIAGTITNIVSLVKGLKYTSTVSKVPLLNLDEEGFIYRMKEKKSSDLIRSLFFIPLQRDKDLHLSIISDRNYSIMLPKTTPVIERYDMLHWDELDFLYTGVSISAVGHKRFQPSQVTLLGRKKNNLIYQLSFEENTILTDFPCHLLIFSNRCLSKGSSFIVSFLGIGKPKFFYIDIPQKSRALHYLCMKKCLLLNYVLQSRVGLADVEKLIRESLCKIYINGAFA
jgi:hypothetical protein